MKKAKKPIIQRLKGRRSVKAGSSLTLRCKAKAKPNPVFTWFKDGVEVTSRRGLRIKNSKRGSRLKISKTDKSMSGVYTCRAANALGEASQNITIKVRGTKLSDHSYHIYEYMNEDANAKSFVSVTVPELIHVACQKQTFCFNGGTCRYIPDLHQKFCQCPKEWAGQRCEILDLYGPGNKDKTREAKLEFERVLIIVGIVIALLVFVVICIASYFLANRRRKRWEARRRVKQRLGPESNLLLDKTDGGARLTHFAPSCKPLAQKETQTDLNFHPPAYLPKPDLEAPPNLLQTCPNNSGTNLYLHDNSFPFLTRTAADTVATAPPAPLPNQKPPRPVSNIDSRDLERNGSRSRLKAVSVNDNCDDRPPSWKGVGQVPDSMSMPIIVDSDGDVSEAIEMNKLGSKPPCTNSNAEVNGLDDVDGMSDLLTPASHQLVAPPVQIKLPSQDSFQTYYNPPGDGKVSDDSTRLPPCFDPLESTVPLPEEFEMSGHGREEKQGSLPFNGVVEDWDSDDEVPDKPLLPLHISEEDLNDNPLRLDSFVSGSPSPPPPPPPEPFAKDPGFTSLSPAHFVPAYRPTDLPQVEPDRSQRPGSLSEDDSAGFLPHTLSSTEASSPLTEGTPQGETYAFDPCMDSDPDCFDEQFMHGSPKKGPGCYKGAEDQQDYERRLRNVCADQDAIPI